MLVIEQQYTESKEGLIEEYRMNKEEEINKIKNDHNNFKGLQENLAKKLKDMVQEKQKENEQAMKELEQLRASMDMQTLDKENLAKVKESLHQENLVLKDQMQAFKEESQQ